MHPICGPGDLKRLYAEGDLSAVFEHLDDDGNGRLTYAELKAKLLPQAAVRQLHKLRTGASLRRVRRISSERLESGPGALPVQIQLKGILRANMMRLTDLFRRWDSDGNGRIDKREFREAIGALGYDAPPAEVNRLFEEFDIDGSGVIDHREIHALLR